MNFAFQAVFFLLLLIPGFIFRSNYNGRILKDQLQSFTPFSNEAIYVIIISASLNSFWVIVSNAIGRIDSIAVQIDLPTVMFLLLGNYGDTELLQRAIDSVSNHPIPILLYFISLYALSSILGKSMHYVIRKYGLDIKFALFRFRNPWHYILTGEVMEIDNPNADEVDLVSVSAIIDDYLYIGALADYELDERGNLARITLEKTYRRKLSDDATSDNTVNLEEDSRYYKIRGDYFIIDCSNTRNLNIDYWYLPEETEVPS